MLFATAGNNHSTSNHISAGRCQARGMWKAKETVTAPERQAAGICWTVAATPPRPRSLSPTPPRVILQAFAQSRRGSKRCAGRHQCAWSSISFNAQLG